MIRRYVPDDLDGAAEVFRSAFANPPWNEKWDISHAADRIRELMSAPQSVGYVYDDRGSIKAVLCGRVLTYLHGAEYVIDEFCVAADMQRCGIGSAVIDHVYEELSEQGVVAMALMTTRGYPSERFYIKKGFTGNDDMVFMYRAFDK